MNLLERIGRERLLFGHRGVPDQTPENTLASFQKAVDLGLDGIELDARLCKTGELVVFHDDRLDKITDGAGLIAEMPFAYIRQLDAGSHFDRSFHAEKIPTLEEALEVLGNKMIVNIELKSKSIRDDGLEAKVIPLVEKMGLESSVIFSSFNPFSVRRTRKINPKLTVALLFAEDQPIHLRQAWGSYVVELSGLHPRYPLVNEKLMERAATNKWFVCTWTVDKAGEVGRMFEAGVDIVITNHPERIRTAIAHETGGI
jgi:glycerophosphoryl diester phosphodiesterase